jgi:thioredoxin reductase (NADPH)
MNTVVYEAESYGGQIINTPEIENYPAIAKISGFDFADGLYKQAEALGAEIKFDKVTEIRPVEGGFEVATEYSGTETCKAVVLAVGAKNRHMGIAREEELTGKGVSYCATCDGAFYKGKTVAVTGGGNTAVEDAIYLCGMAEKVYLVHRRNEFRAEETLVNAAKAIENLEFVTPYVVKELKGEPKLSSVILENREDGSEKELAVDGLFVAIGQEPATASFKDLVTLTGGYIEAGEDCRTNVPGIFAAGDGRTKKVRQLTTACADGAVAALAAVDFIKLG